MKPDEDQRSASIQHWSTDVKQLEEETDSILRKYGKSKNRRFVNTSEEEKRERPRSLTSSLKRRSLSRVTSKSELLCKINTNVTNVTAAIKIQRLFRSKLNKTHVTGKTVYRQQHNGRLNGQRVEESIQSETYRVHPRLFKEDGSANLSLKAAVAEALKTHRFDNIPAVFLHDRFGKRRNPTSFQEIVDIQETTPHKNVAPNATLLMDRLFSSEENKFVSNVSFTREIPSNVYRSKRKMESPNDPISLRDIHYPGFEPISSSINSGSEELINEERGASLKKKHEVCFNCWSACKSDKCQLLRNQHNSEGNNLYYVCDLWGLRFLRQRYRCEIDPQSSCELSVSRFTKDNRRRSSKSDEQLHPMLKSLSKHIEIVNLRARRHFHIKQWFKTFINHIKLNVIDAAAYARSVKKLRDMGTMANILMLQHGTNDIQDQLPRAPTTFTDCAATSVINKVMVFSDKGLVESTLITPGPTPTSNRLYEPKACEILPVSQIKLESSTNGNDTYALFRQKKRSDRIAVGGLNREVILQQTVQTVFPAEYCDFIVEDFSVSVPDVTLETHVASETFVIKQKHLEYRERELQHILNTRRVPTITIKVGISANEKNYFGLNRPDQTGEMQYCGFRTSESSTLPHLESKIETSPFTPTRKILSPNTPKQLQPERTNVDLSYPFCDTQSRQNSIEDLSYLLQAVDNSTPNKPQTFTIMTFQEPGKFMKNCNNSLPSYGKLRTVVTRSWTFLQKRRIAKFVSRDGVPYWFDHRTGQTCWERPLCEEETLSIKEGGVLLGSRSNDYTGRIVNYNDAIKSRALIRKLVLSQHKQSIKSSKDDTLLKSAPLTMRKPNSNHGPDDQREKDLNNADEITSEQTDSSFTNKAYLQSHEGSYSKTESENIGENININPSFRRDDEWSVSSKDLSGRCSVDNQIMHVIDNEEQCDERKGDVINCDFQSDMDESTCTDLHKPSYGNSSVCTVNQYQDADENEQSSKLISTITQVIGGMLKDISTKQQDVLKLGVGLGISLGAKGILNIDEAATSMSQGQQQQQQQQQQQPLSVTTGRKSDEDSGRQQDDYASSIAFPSIHESKLSDEVEDYSRLTEKSRKIIESNHDHPLPKSNITHSILETGNLSTMVQRKHQRSNLRSFKESIKLGFLDSIKSRNVGKQYTEYIDYTPNLPKRKPVGRVKPRSAGQDWLAIGFDPWSTGKEILNVEFVPFLVGKETNNHSIPFSAPSETVHKEQDHDTNVMKTKFKQLCSCIRHGNYFEFEQMLEDCEGIIPIDYMDDVGNTLLMVSCQNGNKRMVKLCLRKGCDINKQNTNGHTSLHYAFGYGFDDLGAYLISKGADDNIANAEGLTCYEGLRMEDIFSL